jgi:hypothetical protein
MKVVCKTAPHVKSSKPLQMKPEVMQRARADRDARETTLVARGATEEVLSVDP